jgi:hypothetical protein
MEKSLLVWLTLPSEHFVLAEDKAPRGISVAHTYARPALSSTISGIEK